MLHYLTGSEHKIVHAYKVSGWGCRISRVRQTRSYMPTRYQDEAAGSHGFGTTVPTYIRRGCRTCQVGAAGSHRLGTGDRTYLRGIRTGLQDLTGSANQISSNMHTRNHNRTAGSHG